MQSTTETVIQQFFFFQAFFAGLGAIIAALLGWLLKRQEKETDRASANSRDPG